MSTCSTPGCDRPFHARGRCARCYDRWRKANPLQVAGRVSEERAAFIEDVEFMIGTGESPVMIAHRLGSNLAAVEKRLRTAGRSDLAAAFWGDAHRSAS